MTIPNGNFIIKLIINEQKPNESGYALFTLEKGKTIEDVKTWQSADQLPCSFYATGCMNFLLARTLTLMIPANLRTMLPIRVAHTTWYVFALIQKPE